MGGQHPNSDIRPLCTAGSMSRILLSKRILTPLGWTKHAEDFGCIGVFRTASNFLIAPLWLETDEGTHPLEILFHYEVIPSAEEVMPLQEIPPVSIITAPNRIVHFSATWTKQKNQLNLNVGTVVTKKLGWRKENSLPIFPAIWGPFLCLASQEEFLQAQTKDFTNGHLRT